MLRNRRCTEPDRATVLRRPLISWALTVLVLTSCSCPHAGCGADIRLMTQDAALLANAEDFEIEVCVDGECSTLSIGTASDHPADEVLTFASGSSTEGEAHIEITTTDEDGNAQTASGTVMLEETRPNSGFCPPICAIADVGIQDDSVDLAEPGRFPPRS